MVTQDERNREAFFRDTWADLIVETLRSTAIVTLVIYWIWQLAVGGDTRGSIASNTVILTIYGIGLFVVTLLTLDRHPRMAAAVWSLGLCLGGLLAEVVLGTALPLYIVPLACLTAALLVGEVSGLIIALIGVLPMAWPWLAPRDTGSSMLMAILGWSAATIAIGGALRRAMYNIVHWYVSSHKQALDSMQQARQRRGEMVRLVKELDTAYYRLARLNASLIQAWRRATEAESRRAELVTAISHELRTPLNLVLGFSELVMASPESYGNVPLPPVYRRDVGAIYRSSKHLLQLVDDVLDLAKSDVGKLAIVRQVADLGSIVAECVMMVQEYVQAKGIGLHSAIEPDLPAIAVDRLRIRQVILNLLTNAARFTDKGDIRLTVSRQGEELLVTVKDTGRGISPDRLQTIFDEFDGASRDAQEQHSGTGLGVPISRKLVELHGGRMWLESTLGRGTSFHFTLPLDGCTSQTAQLAYDPLPARLASRPVLLVVTRDESLMQWLCRKVEAEVVAARDPEEAWQAAQEVHPCLVIADSGEHMDLDIWNAPILQLALPDRHRLATTLGMQMILSKPVTKEALLCALETHAPAARTILVVDDDSRFSELIGRMLAGKTPAVRLLAASTGEEALSMVGTEEVEALILDQRLGETTGVELCERIRRLPGHSLTPAILVSAYDLDQLTEHRAMHASLHLPVGLDGAQTLDLVSAVFGMLSRQSSFCAGAPWLVAAMPG